MIKREIFNVIAIFVAIALCIVLILKYKSNNQVQCPPAEKPGIYTRTLGSTTIDNEECQLFETYELFDCYQGNKSKIKGKEITCINETTFCNERMLIRLTKCPSNAIINNSN